MSYHDLFSGHGAHVLVDGQFGSTGKGVLAAFLAREATSQGVEFDAVLSNAGPNSGHTFYDDGDKHVLKQLPTFAVASHLMGHTIPVFLTAGAIIDPDILYAEADRYPHIPIKVHPFAAVITQADKDAEHSGSIAAVAGTRSGTGAALARKVLRDPGAVWGGHGARRCAPPNVSTINADAWPVAVNCSLSLHRHFIEVSQGFSLGLNQQFYPKCTSRECTVAQALSDASVSPKVLSKVYMSIRAHPIRVGNVDGYSSGDWYYDQTETSWEELGVEAEITTVTKRVRRVATFSEAQFRDAYSVNQPDFVFANFLNYLSPPDQEAFLARLSEDLVDRTCGVIPCYGATSDHVGALR